MKNLSQLLSDFRAARSNMETLSKNVPKIIGNESVKVVKNNFILSGYDSGTGVTGWKEREASTNDAYDKRSGVKGSTYNSENPLLLQTRNLYNAVKYQVEGKTVFIGVDMGLVPYAKYVNEDTTTPRQYIPKPNEGPSPKILTNSLKKIESERDKAMHNFKK